MFNIAFSSISLTTILLIETIAFVIGFILNIYEIKILFPTISNKATKGLLTFLITLNLSYLARAVGIYLNDPMIRKYGPALLGFFATLLLMYWGSLIIEMSRKSILLLYSGIITGMIIYFLGRTYPLIFNSNIGIGIIALTCISLVVALLKYVFNESPYIMARKRVFSISFSFSLLFITEGLAIAFIGVGNYKLSALFFFLRIFIRIGMSFSLTLPNIYDNILSKFIK